MNLNVEREVNYFLYDDKYAEQNARTSELKVVR